jgi:hypothetical protein
MGVGLPALPALVQRQRVMRTDGGDDTPLWGGFMAPPEQPVKEQEHDKLAEWHRELKTRFELGTLYTMVAGLLNVLVIYDAFAGPVFTAPNEKNDKPPDQAGAKKSGDEEQ